MNYRCKSSCKEHSRKGNDERLNVKIRNEKSLYKTERKTYAKCDKHRGDDVAAFKVEVDRACHAYKSDDSANGDVDAACYHYKRKSAGDDDKVGVVVELIEESLRLSEALTKEDDSTQIHKDEYNYCNSEQQVGIRHLLDSLHHAAAPPSLLLSALAVFLKSLLTFSLTTGALATTRRITTIAL